MNDHFQLRLTLAAVVCLLLPSTSTGADNGNWRFFRSTDGLRESFCVAVKVGPRGTVWVRHREGGGGSRLNGFDVAPVPGLAGSGAPLVEGRYGQTWTIYPGGVAELGDNQWILHPSAEVQAENRANPMRPVRPIPILPADRDRVLILLPESLLSLQTRSEESTVMLRASQTGLGRFIDLIEDREGLLWLTGVNGLLRFDSPARRLGVDAPRQEFRLAEAKGVRNFERPMPSANNGFTLLADTPIESQRAVVRLDGSGLRLRGVTARRIRFAWEGPDGLWALTRDALVRWPIGRAIEEEPDLALSAHYYDVDVETNGVFWLATSDMLLRRAPSLWQVDETPALQGALVLAIHEDPAGELWIAHGEGISRRTRLGWEAHPLHHDSDLTMQSGDQLFPLADQRFIFNIGDSVYALGPARAGDNAPAAPLALEDFGKSASVRIRRLVGRDADLAALVLLREDRKAGAPITVWQFDGRRLTEVIQVAADAGLGGDLLWAHRTSDGRIWLTGTEGAAVVVDGRLIRLRDFGGRVPNRPNCLLELGADRVWLGSRGQLWQFDGQAWQLLREDFERIHALLRTRDGEIWVASNGGLFRYAEGSWLQNGVEEGLPSTIVYSLFEDREGTLWAGTARGLARYIRSADVDPPRSRLLSSDPLPVSTRETLRIDFEGADKWKQTLVDRLLFSYRLDQELWSPFTSASSVDLANLPTGDHQIGLRAMDRAGNISTQLEQFNFGVILPWYLEPRVVLTGTAGLLLALGLAGFAVNRHLQLRRSYAEVERIVEVRTRELEHANQALLHSQKMKALGTLAAGVAHDFNNILSIIKGSAQIIEGHLDEKDKIRTRVSRIKTVVDQGSAIVKAMLGLARIRREDLAPCDLNAVTAEAVKVLEDRFGAGVVVRFLPAPELPPVSGVRDLIHQMLFNLVINAADAMGGHGTVTIRTALADPPPPQPILDPSGEGPVVSLRVEDEGCGIRPENLSRIFDPFFTTKAMSSRRGTGLGLTMVYECAKEMGYGLHVESQEGHGSRFTVLMRGLPPGSSGHHSQAPGLDRPRA